MRGPLDTIEQVPVVGGLLDSGGQQLTLRLQVLGKVVGLVLKPLVDRGGLAIRAAPRDLVDGGGAEDEGDDEEDARLFAAC